MEQDRHGIAVHTMSPVHRRGPVFYASLPRETEPPREEGIHTGAARRRLVFSLWERLVSRGCPRGKGPPSSPRAALPIQVVRDPLGKPHLLLGQCPGPAISFSEGGGAVWAALCGDESDIGIDVAEADDFQGDYPLHRVFDACELQHAMKLAGGKIDRASALLWSIKEAVAKALGCGFHLVEPLDICVHPARDEHGEHIFPVCLSGKALERFPMGAGRSIWVRSLPQAERCLSIALLNWRCSWGDGRRHQVSSAPEDARQA